MAKRRAARPSSASPENDSPASASPAAADRKVEPGHEQGVDQSPEVKLAADAVQQAETELKKARELYGKVRREATDQLKRVREKTLGDAIDGMLGMVKKHPGPGVIVAVLIGFFLGRLFRR